MAERKNLVNHLEKVNNIFHSHHHKCIHKYIDTFSIKFNYARQNVRARMWTWRPREGRRKEKKVFIPSNSIYLFEYLTRSSNKFSQLANQMFLTEIWDSLLLLRRFFLQTWFTRNWNLLSYWILLSSDITLLITTNENIAKVSSWQKSWRARKNQKFINLLNFFPSFNLLSFQDAPLFRLDATKTDKRFNKNLQ